MAYDRPLLAVCGYSQRRFSSELNDRFTSEAAIHILVAENSVRTSASPPKAAAELISLLGAADDPKRTYLVDIIFLQTQANCSFLQ